MLTKIMGIVKCQNQVYIDLSELKCINLSLVINTMTRVVNTPRSSSGCDDYVL